MHLIDRLSEGLIEAEDSEDSDDESEENEHGLSSAEAEARLAAARIREIIASEEYTNPFTGETRPYKYSDFAILLRNHKARAPVFAKVLKEYGIPVSYEVEDFTGNIEIDLTLRLLSVIDNPHNDIDLLNVLFSPIYSFSANEEDTLERNFR